MSLGPSGGLPWPVAQGSCSLPEPLRQRRPDPHGWSAEAEGADAEAQPRTLRRGRVLSDGDERCDPGRHPHLWDLLPLHLETTLAQSSGPRCPARSLGQESVSSARRGQGLRCCPPAFEGTP